VLVFSADFESASDFIGECYIKYEPLSTALPKQKSAEKNCFRGEKNQDRSSEPLLPPGRKSGRSNQGTTQPFLL
jgi:hypothetical protein